MTAQLIDGKKIAELVRQEIAECVADLKKTHQLQPGLAVVLVGEDAASQVYVRNKGVATREVGMASFEHRLPADTSEADVLDMVTQLNKDPAVNGVLVQFPVPDQIRQDRIVAHIDPAKDVDGLHPINAGYLASGMPGLVPCTPQGSVILAKRTLGDLTGLNAVIIGRSNLVGKPVAQLLLAENATVTVAHSRTRDLPAICRAADLLIAAVGIPKLVQAEWVKPGATLIDVGINRIDDPETGKTRLVGDLDFEACREVAAHITPVPGGVGPMTIACLLRNTVIAACRQNGLDDPRL